jgi:hypothetical protein
MRLRLDGGLWPYVDVEELSSEAMVLRTPGQPEAFVGHVVGFTVMNSRGVIVAAAVEHSLHAETTRYRARIVHQEPGLAAAIEEASLTPGRNPVRITHRMWRRPPREVLDEELLIVLERAIRLSGVDALSDITAVLVVRLALACGREHARRRLHDLVAGELLERVDYAPGRLRYRVR